MSSRFFDEAAPVLRRTASLRRARPARPRSLGARRRRAHPAAVRARPSRVPGGGRGRGRRRRRLVDGRDGRLGDDRPVRHGRAPGARRRRSVAVRLQMAGLAGRFSRLRCPPTRDGGVQADQAATARDLVGLMLAQTPPEDDEAAWMVEEISRPPASVASAILFDQTVRDYREVLPKVDVPSLVVNGRHDKLIPVSAAEFVATTMPAGRSSSSSRRAATARFSRSPSASTRSWRVRPRGLLDTGVSEVTAAVRRPRTKTAVR